MVVVSVKFGLLFFVLSLAGQHAASTASMAQKDKEFIGAAAIRGLKIESIQKVDSILEANVLPALDIKTQFEFDSAKIGRKSTTVLDKLGKAISDPSLSSSRIMLNGLSDAKGAEEYNRDLSQRMAEAVRDFLVSRHSTEPDRMPAFGFGVPDLTDRSSFNPDANRQVEIIDLRR